MVKGGAAVSFTLKLDELKFHQAPPELFTNAELSKISLGVRINSFIECIYLYPTGILKSQVFKESLESSKSSDSPKSRFSKYHIVKVFYFKCYLNYFPNSC